MKKAITLFFTIITSAGFLFGQIPNGNFESWTYTTAGYNIPNSWDNLDSITSPTNIYTCISGGTRADTYLKLITKNIVHMGLVPGVATCGTLDVSNINAPTAKNGFPFTSRPQALAGKWQFMGFGTDTGYISILLTKWDSVMATRDTIAATKHSLDGMVMTWDNFNIPITYFSSAIPDTAFITLSASGTNPIANSYLYVDTLHFADSTLSDTTHTGILSISQFNDIICYPNPASDVLTIQLNNTSSHSLTIQLSNVDGKVVRELSAAAVNDSNRLTIDVTGLIKGIYFLKLVSDKNAVCKRVIIE